MTLIKMGKRNDKSSKRKTAVRTILYHLLFIALDFEKGVKYNLFFKKNNLD